MALLDDGTQAYKSYLTSSRTPVASATPPALKQGGFLGHAFQSVTGLLNRFTMGAKKATAFGLAPIAAPIVSGIEKANPTKFSYVPPPTSSVFTNRVSPQTIASANKRTPIDFSGPGTATSQVANAARLIGKEDVAGALKSSGAFSGPKNKWGSIATDILINSLTDPTTALAFGVGKGATIAGRAGESINLTQKGTQLLKSHLTDVIKEAGLTGEQFAKLAPFERLALEDKAGLRLAETASKTKGLIDKGGVKLAGHTLLPGEVTTKPLGGALQKVADTIGINKFLGPGSRDHLIKNNLAARRIFQQFHDVTNATNAQFAETLGKASSGLSKGEREAAAVFRATGQEAPGKLKPILDLANTTFNSYGRQLEKRGLVKGLLQDYLPIISKNPDQVINGVTLKDFLGSRIAPNFKFGKSREFFDSFIQAKQAGYDVETDIGEMMAGYVKSANRAIAKQDLLKSLVDRFGVPKEVLTQGAEPAINASFKFNQPTKGLKATKEPLMVQPKPVEGITPPVPGVPPTSAVEGITPSIPTTPVLPTPVQKGVKLTFKGQVPETPGKISLSKSENFTTPTLERVPNKAATSLTGEPLVSVQGTTELANHSLPKNIVDHLSSLDQSFVKDAGTARALKLYDNILNVYRGALTTVFPAFHFRNEVSNTLQNALDIGLLRAIDPKLNLAATKLLSGKSATSAEEILLGGQKYTVGGLRKMMQDLGVIQGQDPFEVVGNISKANLGRRTGRFIENRARAVNFIANLEKTGSPVTAAEHVKQFLFDYQNLSPFERNTLRRVFLFPTWNSRNALLQIDQAFRKPGFFSKYGIIQNRLNQERTSQQSALLPGYETSDINVPFGTDAQGNPKTLLPTNTPFSQAFQVANPKNLLSMLAPGIKIPAELTTGIDFFKTSRAGDFKKLSESNTGRELSVIRYLPENVQKAIGFSAREQIDPKTGKPTGRTNYQANPYLAYFIRNNPLSRFTSTAGTFSDATTSTAQDILRVATGARVDTTNLESQAKGNITLYQNQLAQPLIQNGSLYLSNGRYFVPNNVQLSTEEKTLADNVAKTLNDKQSVTSMYLASIGADPTSFPDLTSSTSTKKLSNKSLAALLAYQSGKPELAARILVPNSFKFASGKSGRRAKLTFRKPPSSKGVKAGKLPKISSKGIKFKAPKPKAVRLAKPKRVRLATVK